MEAGNPNFCDFARPSFSVVCTFHTHKAERGTKIVLRLDILYSLPYAVLVFKTVARPILQHVGRKASPFPLPVRGGWVAELREEIPQYGTNADYPALGAIAGVSEVLF